MINQLDIDYPNWAFVLPILLGFLFSLLLYFRNKNNKISPQWSIFLSVLRFLSTALIALLLLNPFVKTTKKYVQKPKLLLAVDNSQSMLHSSDSVFLLNNLADKIGDFEIALDGKYQTDKLLFGEKVRPFGSIDFSDNLSDYSQVFRYVNKHYRESELAGLLIIGDGIFNYGTEPFYASSDTYFPVYTIAVGDTMHKPDLKINEVRNNSLAYINENIPFEVNLSAQGFAKETIRVKVYANGKLIETRKIKVSSNSFTKTEKLDLKVEKPGRLRLGIVLSAESKEDNTVNNTKSVFIDVLDARQKILILANSPHPDISAIKQALTGFKSYQVDVVFAQNKNIALNDYSLIVLHQLPSNRFPLVNVLKGIEKQKIAVFCVVGVQSRVSTCVRYFSNSGFKSPFRSLENSRAAFNQNFVLFEMDEEDVSILETLPPLNTPLGTFSNLDISKVLAWQEINSVTSNFPLIEFSEKDGRKNCLVMGEGLWKWRNHNYLENSGFSSFDNLMAKSVQYLMAKTDKRYFRIKNRGEYSIREKVVFEAELYDKSYEPIVDASINIKITNEKGEAFDYAFNSLNQTYTTAVDITEPGVYKYSAATTYKGEHFVERGEFVVVGKNIEARQRIANFDLLFKVSDRNNGGFFNLKQIDDLQNQLQQKDVKSLVSYSQTYSGLNTIPFLLLLIVLLLTTEWVLRKYLGNY